MANDEGRTRVLGPLLADYAEAMTLLEAAGFTGSIADAVAQLLAERWVDPPVLSPPIVGSPRCRLIICPNCFYL